MLRSMSGLCCIDRVNIIFLRYPDSVTKARHHFFMDEKDSVIQDIKGLIFYRISRILMTITKLEKV